MARVLAAREDGQTPVYAWWGTDASGTAMRGHLAAGGPAHAHAVLRRQGVEVQRLRRAWAWQWLNALSSALLGKPLSGMQALPNSAMTVFTRQWAALLRAGVPLLGAMELLAQTAGDPRFAGILRFVATDLKKGLSLSAALRRHPQAFDALTCDLIQAAELAGALAPVLERLCEDRERKLALHKKVQSALMYPVTVLLVASGVMSVILSWVVPAFEDVYRSLGGELPLATRTLVSLAQGMRDHGGTVLLGLALGTAMAARVWHQRPTWRLKMAHLLLRLPVWGTLLTQAAVARWSRTLATLTTAGVPLVEALGSVAPACGHAAFAQATEHIGREVAQGQTLSAAIDRTGVFPDLVARLVAIGEETGALEPMLVRVAQFHEDELDALSRGLATLLEPVMMVGMGAVVGAAVLALYWPMFNLGAVI